MRELTEYNYPVSNNRQSTDRVCVLGAQSDLDAVHLWLGARANRSANTEAAYKKEAYRFLDWLRRRRMTFVDATLEDIGAYYRWLANPDAQELAVSRRQAKPLAHKPSVGLGGNAINYSRRVLSQLFAFLVDGGYLQNNVFKISPMVPQVQRAFQARHLSLKAWQFLWAYLESQRIGRDESGLKAARDRWLFALLYHTGIRRENAVAAVMGDFCFREDGWVLRIVSKGRKEQFVIVNHKLLNELRAFRRTLGLTEFPSPQETLPALPAIRGGATQAMSLRNVGHIVRDLAERAANACTDLQIRQQISAMTTHWMRHTSGTHRLLAGATFESIQEEFGHEDLKTTKIYAKISGTNLRENAELLAKL